LQTAILAAQLHLLRNYTCCAITLAAQVGVYRVLNVVFAALADRIDAGGFSFICQYIFSMDVCLYTVLVELDYMFFQQ
jgi:hypothetical protein